MYVQDEKSCLQDQIAEQENKCQSQIGDLDITRIEIKNLEQEIERIKKCLQDKEDEIQIVCSEREDLKQQVTEIPIALHIWSSNLKYQPGYSKTFWSWIRK